MSVEATQSADDLWAGAMAEQAAVTAGTGGGAASAAPTPGDTAAFAGPAANSPGASKPRFEDFSGGATGPTIQQDIDLILDIPVQITVELGRTRIPIKQILQLAKGSVVELDGLVGEPMNLFVNGCLIAQGEVVVVNERFGIRLTDIVTPSERVKKLNR